MSDDKPNNNSASIAKTTKLEKITIKGFKSLKDIEFPLNNINVLVGANGVGKSNFLNFFEMLSWMTRGRSLQEYVARKGGGNDLLFNGSKNTRSIECFITFDTRSGKTEYNFALQHTEDNRLIFSREEYRFARSEYPGAPPDWKSLGVGHEEAKIVEKENDTTAQVTRKILQNCTIYQFHDTSETSPLKFECDVDDNVFLKGNGQNIAALLYDLQQNKNTIYQEIVRNIQLALPIFKDFDLKVHYDKVKLRWLSKGVQDKSFGPHLTSDGTLRFMALVTLLCLPEDRLSNVILLDEPELGLHPYAITLIADLIKRLGKTKQIIIATQSPLLLNAFGINEIVIADMSTEGATQLRHLKKDELMEWLGEYQPGDLWQKNVFGGNP